MKCIVSITTVVAEAPDLHRCCGCDVILTRAYLAEEVKEVLCFSLALNFVLNFEGPG